MRCQTNGRLQSGYREYGNHGESGSSDDCAYSSSSSGSNRQAGPTLPIIRPSSNPVSRVRTPEQPYAARSRAEPPTAPETPISKRSSFTLSGHQISETYKLRPSAIASPPKQSTPASLAIRTDNPRRRANTQYASNTPFTRNTRENWVLGQESKVKILGIPKQYWTKDVYFAMSRFGTVTRVDMETGSRDNNAWVVFQ